ncbi:MAG: hypothetical protein MK193_12595 [Lentisphaeria bacterium]|nr:hypothetical protein [Lentisphaeria bacterium]
MNPPIKKAILFFFGVPTLYVLQTPAYLLGSYCYFVLFWFIYTNFQRTQKDKRIIACIARAFCFSFLSLLVCGALYQVTFSLAADESLDHYIDKTFVGVLTLQTLTVIFCAIIKRKDITIRST